MDGMSNALNLVLVILSIGSILGPLLFGFVIFRMAAFFVTKQQFEDSKILIQTKIDFLQQSNDRQERTLSDILASRKKI